MEEATLFSTLGAGGQAISATKHLHLENYSAFYKDASTASLFPVPRLNEILHIHGFTIDRYSRRKEQVLESLSAMESLVLNPHRSTMSDTFSSHNNFPSIDQVNTGLDSIQWQEEFPIQSLISLPVNASNNDYDTSERRNKRGRKPKQRKVFDALHLTRPRSKRSVVKKKCLSDIFGFGFSA